MTITKEPLDFHQPIVASNASNLNAYLRDSEMLATVIDVVFLTHKTNISLRKKTAKGQCNTYRGGSSCIVDTMRNQAQQHGVAVEHPAVSPYHEGEGLRGMQ